jgi:steroid delta-isomerase-like uncharacterized protein
MAAGALEALARRFVARVLNGRDPAAARALLHPLYVDHSMPALGGSGLESLSAFLGLWRAAFPDVRFAVEHCFGDGASLVAVRLTVTGTHRGPFLGLRPTGRVIRVEGLSHYRVAGGQIVERWSRYDTLGLLRQLGAATPLA